MKVFIAHLMYNRSNEDILNERKVMENKIKEVFKDQDIEIIESYFTDYTPETTSLEFLGRAISALGKADMAVFMPNASECKGCRIEMKCCIEYGIPIRYYINTPDGAKIAADVRDVDTYLSK